MIKQKRLSRMFFGWWSVIGGGVLSLWASGYNHYGFSALFKPIATELGFSRAVTSVAASISRLEGGFESPISGWATDKFGPRWVIWPGIFLMGLSLILMYYIDSLWAFYLVWGVLLGTASNFSTGMPVDTAIANWFVKKRGLAISLKWTISGFSGVLVLPFLAWLISVQGWRMALVVGGVVMWIIGLPIAWFCFKSHRPEYYGLLPDDATPEVSATDTDQMIDRGVKYAAEAEEVEFTVRQALRTPSYWMLIIANATHGLVMPLMTIHTIPFLTDIGIEPLRASRMMALIVLVSLPLRPVGGFLTDRATKKQIRFILGASYAFQAAGFVIYLLNPTITMIYLWFIVYGIGQGLAYGPMTPIWVRYFGRKAVGSIRGSSQFFMTPVGIIAPIYAGWIYDTTGSYITAFFAAAVLLVISIVLISLALPPKPPAQITDVRQIM